MLWWQSKAHTGLSRAVPMMRSSSSCLVGRMIRVTAPCASSRIAVPHNSRHHEHMPRWCVHRLTTTKQSVGNRSCYDMSDEHILLRMTQHDSRDEGL